MKKSTSLITLYILLLGLYLTVPFVVSAQSFFSNQQQIATPVPAIETDPSLAESTRDSDEETPQKIIEDEAEIEKEPAEAQPDSQERLPPQEKEEAEVLVLNESNLEYISDLIEEEQYNHALNNLNTLSLKNDEHLDEEPRFRVQEFMHFLYIKVYYLLGEYEKVRSLSQTYFTAYSNGENFYYAYYYFSSSLNHLNLPLEYTELLTEDFFEKLSAREAESLRTYLIKNAIQQRRFLEAFNYLEESEGELFSQYDKWYRKIISKIEEGDDIEELLERFEQDDIQIQLYLRKVQLLTVKNQYEDAQETLKLLREKEELDSEVLAEIQSLQKYISLTLDTEPYKIGVLLPTSHRSFRFLSRQVIDGLEMALQNLSIKGKPIELVFKDSTVSYQKGEKKRSILNRTDRHIKELVRELVEVENVIAILGPLARQTTLAAKSYSEQFTVPIISFSLTEDIGEDSPFLFRFNRKRTQEAKIIAHYAMDYLNASRFVLFYPPNKKGFDLIQSFSKVVKEKGGEIVGFSRVKKNQVDFQNAFLSITDGYRTISKEEQEELQKSRERLKPVVDFDAIFAPTTTNTLEIISSFQSLFEADKTWLLALSDVNVQENQLLTNTKQLRFVDAYANSDSKTYLQPFFESHWRNYNYRRNYTPPTDYTVYAYESLEILGKLLNDPRNHNREALRKTLEKLDHFPVLTGQVTSDKNGELIKELKILKLKRKNTIEVF